MKFFWQTAAVLLLLTLPVFSQSPFQQATVPVGSGANAGVTPSFAQLPLFWADDTECNPPNGVFDVVKTIGLDYPATAAGLNSAILDWTTSGIDQWESLQIPLTFTNASPLIISSQVILLGKPNATKCLVIQGTGTIIPDRTLCSHQTGDNPDGSSPRNLGCTNDSAQLAVIEGRWTPGNNGILFTACVIGGANCSVGENHIAFKHLEMRPQPNTNFSSFKLFNLNDQDTSGLLGCNHMWFIQNYIHGDTPDVPAGLNKIASVIDFSSCSYSGAVFNYFDKVASLSAAGNESHIITATWMPGPFEFDDNWVEGSSINIFFGGAAATILPYENVYDGEIRRNRFTKAAAWMPLSQAAGQLALKSDGEVKVGTRILVDGNIFEYSNTSGGQKGQCFTLTVRNTSGGASGENYNNSIDNITFTNNICRHAVSGIETAGRSSSGGNGGGAAQPGRNWFFQNNLFYDIAPGTAVIYNNKVTIPFLFEIGAGGNTWTSSSVTRDATGTFTTFVPADGGAGLHETTMGQGDPVQVSNCVDPTFNTPTHGASFFAEGPAALQGTTSFVLSGGNPTPGPVIYPNVGTPNATTTGCVLSNGQGFQAGFTVRHVSAFGGFFGSVNGPGQAPSCLSIDSYALNFIFQDNLIAPLPSQYSGLMCQGDGNTEGTVSEGNMADLSTLVLNHVVFGPNGTAPNWAKLHSYVANAVITDTSAACSGGCFETETVSSCVSQNPGPPSWSVSAPPQVTADGTCSWTSSASLARKSSLYTEYPGAINPPSTIWTPTNVPCALAIADITCFGFSGMMNGAAYEANATNYHDYALDPTSPYYKGNSRQASDGTSMGVDIPAIDAAINRTKYICKSNCGLLGPNQD